MDRKLKRHRAKPDVRVVLYIDRGLAAWLRAYVKAVSLAGERNDTIIFMVRNAIFDATKNDNVMLACYPHLPKGIREACAGWREAALEREANRRSELDKLVQTADAEVLLPSRRKAKAK